METTSFRKQIIAINLRRIERFFLTTVGIYLGISLVWAAFLLFRTRTIFTFPGPLLVLIVTLLFLAIVSALRKCPPAMIWRERCVLALFLGQMSLGDYHFFNGFPYPGVSNVYVLGIICLGIFILLPPPLFAGLILANHTLYILQVLRPGISVMDRQFLLVEGTAGVILAIFASSLLYAAEKKSHEREQALLRRSAELDETNTALRERNEDLLQITAIAAHDLRSPLLALSHLLDEIGRGDMNPPEQGRFLREGKRTCATMLAQISHWLRTHTAEAHRRENPLLGTDLIPALAEAARRVRPLAAKKGICLDLLIPHGAIPVRHDPDALSQVLDNLLSNAVKYSPWDGTIILELSPLDRTRCHIEIHDEGPGIPETERPFLFQKFFRGQNQSQSEPTQPGSGLGLFIARTRIEGMGGAIAHTPRTPHGSTFRITLGDTDGAA